MRQLHRFPGDAVKLDRSFVVPMLEDEGASDIVKAIVSLAHNLGHGGDRRGVETQAHLDRLKVLGCEYAQGFFIAGPLDAGAATALLERGTADAMTWRSAGALLFPPLVLAALLVLRCPAASAVTVGDRAPSASVCSWAAGRPSALGRRDGAVRRSSSGAVGARVPLPPVTPREAVALVVLDQLVVGQTAIVHLGLGLVALGLGALGARLLRGDLGLLLLTLSASVARAEAVSRCSVATRSRRDSSSCWALRSSACLRACAAAGEQPSQQAGPPRRWR